MSLPGHVETATNRDASPLKGSVALAREPYTVVCQAHPRSVCGQAAMIEITPMKDTFLAHDTQGHRFQGGHLPTSVAPGMGMRLLTPLIVASIMLFIAAFSRSAAAAEQEEKLLALLAKMEASYAKVEDYSAIFRKLERVKDVLLPEEKVLLKFKKPLQIYMRWIEGPLKEAIYVEGENNNKVVAHSDGLGWNLTWHLDPKGSVLLAGNRHPITDIGFGFILDLMRTSFPIAIKHGEIEIIRMEDVSFEGRPATVVETKLTPKDGRKYYATRMVCHIDKEYLLPVGIACYDEKDELMEEYDYKDVKINIGLTETDFSKKNPNYKF